MRTTLVIGLLFFTVGCSIITPLEKSAQSQYLHYKGQRWQASLTHYDNRMPGSTSPSYAVINLYAEQVGKPGYLKAEEALFYRGDSIIHHSTAFDAPAKEQTHSQTISFALRDMSYAGLADSVVINLKGELGQKLRLSFSSLEPRIVY